MYTLNWQPPYDWSWMLGFLAARAVSGVETVADSYYARSLAVGEYRGVVTAIPDIARHTLHINLSAGLEPVADAPRDKCTLSCAINGIHAAFHYLKKNYISGCVMTVPTG
ncbi:AlkA N-terminal domain-containing protein [Escherichia coli]